MAVPRLGRTNSNSLLSPVEYDADAVSIRSDQDSDSEDDELQLRARNSRELRAHDRILFMEEDEADQLVTDARRREQDRGRRSSGLAAVVSPLRLFAMRRTSDSNQDGRPATGRSSMSGMSGMSGTAIGSTDSLLGKEPRERIDSGSQRSLKRQKRRQRRQAKKERLLSQARNGEDGQLMYELEAGGMKDGSSTGDDDSRSSRSSSSRYRDDEDSDQDEQRLLPGEQSHRRRSSRRCGHICGRWVLVHLLAAVAFALLLLGAWKLSLDKRRQQQEQQKQPLVSNGTALFAPTTLIISLDGFRADFLQRGLTPRLNAFVQEGVSPRFMLPSFPSVTFPNHYTLATGLYPESHGVVGNTFWDPELAADFYYTDPERSLDPKWWGGEPFWVTAEQAGVRSAVHMWPGSEAHIQGIEPTYVDKFDGDEPLAGKVARVLEFLDKPGFEDASPSLTARDRRPQLIAAYVPNVDADGHRYGPNSTEIRSTIAAVDAMLDDMFRGLEERNLTHIVNVIIVSDHGMATTDVTRLMQLEDLVGDAASRDGSASGMARIAHVDGWPLVGLRPSDDADLADLHATIVNNTRDNPNVEVYLRDVDMPERYHFSNNERIAPLWLVPKAGWNIVQREEFDVAEGLAQSLVYHPRGLHGYDHEHPLMRAIFIARGPAFPHEPNSRLAEFQNIEVYNMVCDSIGLEPKPNNGTLRLPLTPTGLHSTGDSTEEPADPVPPYTLTTSTVAAATAEALATTAEATAPTEPTESTESQPTESELTESEPTESESTESVPTLTTSTAPVSTDSATPTPDDDSNALNRFKSAAHDFWNWLTDSVDKAWDKVTGSGEAQSSN